MASVTLAVSELSNLVRWLSRRDPETAKELKNDRILVEIETTETGIGSVVTAHLKRMTPDGWQRDETSQMNITNYDLW